MRFKVGALLVLSCLCTAVAMAISGGERAGADSTSSEIVGAVEKSPSHSALQSTSQEQAEADAHFDLGSIRRGATNKSHTSSLFQSKSWYTPPPAPPQPVVSSLPPPPSAPQLPYTYIGKMVDGKDVVLFLLNNDREYTVRENDVLDDTYRVDKITDKEAVLTYIPLNIQQTLALNSTMTTNSSMVTAGANPQMPPSPPPQLQQAPNLTQLTK